MIKKIFFKNFKCYENAELSIENITTLIGTNSSGKTNAIEGIMILSEIVSGKDIITILDGTRNGGAVIRGGSSGCSRFFSGSFTLGCIVQYNDETDLLYEISLNVEDKVNVKSETLTYIYGNNKKKIFVTREDTENTENIIVFYNNGKNGRNTGIICNRSFSVISQVSAKIPLETDYGKRIADYAECIINNLRKILFLSPEFPQMRGYSQINDNILKINASNISSVLYKLCKNDINKKILVDITRKLPENEISGISFAEGPLNDVIFFINEIYGGVEEKIDASRLSDGTLSCLAIIAAVLSEEEGGMVIIEEIDNGLHPGRAKILIQQISDIARKRKIDILFTTHNPVLLNTLNKDDLYGVNIVYRENNNGSGKITTLVNIKDMPMLLAIGKLGDVFTNGRILDFIKKKQGSDSYSWLGVQE